MKNVLIIILTLCFYIQGISQGNEKRKFDKLLKELSENGCKCVDSINTINKSKEKITIEISKCIDNQTGAYQLGVKFINIKELEKRAEVKDGKKQINYSIFTNKDSEEYLGYYYEVEGYMMNHCTSFKNKIAASDFESKKSYSENPIAKKLYLKGIKESDKENYKKAITYFRKAIGIDSVFAFAWDNIGICNRKLKNYDEAIYAYNKSLQLDPKGILPLQNIAVVYKFKKEYEKAISAYIKLAELDQNNPEVYFGIGEIYSLYIKDYGKGLENICKAYNLYIEQKSPYRSDAEKIIGIIYNEMKKLGKEDQFNEILKENDITPDFE